MFINFVALGEYAKIGFAAASKGLLKLPWKQIAKVAVPVGAAGAGAAAGSAATAAAKDKAHEVDLAEKDKVIQMQEARLSNAEKAIDQMVSGACDGNVSSLDTEESDMPAKEAVNPETEAAPKEHAEEDVNTVSDTEECA